MAIPIGTQLELSSGTVSSMLLSSRKRNAEEFPSGKWIFCIKRLAETSLGAPNSVRGAQVRESGPGQPSPSGGAEYIASLGNEGNSPMLNKAYDILNMDNRTTMYSAIRNFRPA